MAKVCNRNTLDEKRKGTSILWGCCVHRDGFQARDAGDLDLPRRLSLFVDVYPCRWVMLSSLDGQYQRSNDTTTWIMVGSREIDRKRCGVSRQCKFYKFPTR